MAHLSDDELGAKMNHPNLDVGHSAKTKIAPPPGGMEGR